MVLRLGESFLILVLAFSFSKFSFHQKTKPRTEAHVDYARTTCKLRALNAFNVRTCTTASSFTKFTFFENGHTCKLRAHYCKLHALNAFYVRTCTMASSSFTKFAFFENRGILG